MYNSFMSPSDLDILIKITIAAISGIVIGLDRQINNKPAGTRTQMLICVCSALLSAISIRLAFLYRLPHATSTPDPARLMAQVITGIGFLGAGVILKENNRISGVTTAATIWLTAGIGIAIGAGFYIPAVFCIALVLLLHPLARLEYKLGIKSVEYILQIPSKHSQKILKILNEKKIRYVVSSITKDGARFVVNSSHSHKKKLIDSFHKENIIFEIFDEE